VGRAKHVMLAIGHGSLSFPPALARAREDPQLAERMVQAYEAKAYAAGGRYVVVGAGIAAVNEWVNAIDAGASVVSLLRNHFPDEQDLNTPRCLFEALGIDIFQGLRFDERIVFLGKVLKGTSPRRRSWVDSLSRARTEGRFDEQLGEIDRIQAGPAGLRIQVTGRDGRDVGELDLTGVVAATGFNKSPLAAPLLRRMAQHYGIPVDGGRIVLRSNCGAPGLDLPESRLCTMGLLANSVVPHGDTIAGLKYIGWRFVADCARAEGLRRRSFLSRVQMRLSLGSATSTALRHVRRTRQLA
jgi:hypothetical protein